MEIAQSAFDAASNFIHDYAVHRIWSIPGSGVVGILFLYVVNKTKSKIDQFIHGF